VKPLVIDQKTIRAENRKRILQLLISKREVTIPEISRELEISIPTVTKNISQLIAEGMAEEAGVSESTGGRRPMLIRFLPNAYYSFGIEFSTSGYVRIILTNLDSVITSDRILRNPDFKDIDTLMRDIQHHVEGILLDRQIPLEKVLAVGFSLPGTVNEETRLLKIAPNLGIRNCDFAKYESLFQLPLFVENDANAAAMAELTLGIAITMRNIVYLLILPQGIGGGIVVGGHIYRGRNKRAGEFSHMTIASQGRQCSCGRLDCWEMYASANSLVRMYREKTAKELSTFEEFFAALKKYDPAAVEVFDKYLEYLALGIQNIILIQDPHYVIIGGVISPFAEIFLESLQAKVFVENSFYDKNDVEIICSSLKENASILGASLLPFEKIFALHDI
jgi:predicted NBD/HSP70 family sugar kinase